MFGLVALLAVVVICYCKAEDETSQWSYSDYANYGPSQWALVAFDDDALTNTCDGSAQSPIAIAETTHCNAYADYRVRFLCCWRRHDAHTAVLQTSTDCTVDQLSFSITDHNVQATVSDPTLCSIHGLVDNTDATWNLLTVHAHLGWEHTPNARCGIDEAARSEVHFIHESSVDGSLLVVAVWLDASESESDSNEVLDYLLQQWTALGDDEDDNCQDYVDDDGGGQRRLDDSNTLLRLYDLIPRKSDVYAYTGSLTTPPCTEGVTWRVMDQTMRMSVSQYNTLVQLITGYRDADTCEKLTVAAENRTVRPTMPLNDREVLHLCPTGIRRKLISFWLLGVAAVGAGAAGLLCRHRKVMSDNNQPLILTSTVTELSDPL